MTVLESDVSAVDMTSLSDIIAHIGGEPIDVIYMDSEASVLGDRPQQMQLALSPAAPAPADHGLDLRQALAREKALREVVNWLLSEFEQVDPGNPATIKEKRFGIYQNAYQQALAS